MSWETVIGLEIHVQLSTKSKLFSGGSTGFGAEPNTHVDLIDMGLPGVLPVANREAFYKAIRFGLATNAEINKITEDLAKNFSSKMKLNYKYDKSLIGGLIIKIGSTMIDTSIKNKLQQIENRMIEA